MWKSLRAMARAMVTSGALLLLCHPAEATNGNAAARALPSSNPKVAGLVFEARKALRDDDVRRALTDLKLALGMEPANPYVLTELGIAFNRDGAFAAAEDTLRRARAFGAPDELVLGPLFEAMLKRGENQIVLDLFPDPSASDRSPLAATILRARAAALEALGDEVASQSAMGRSLAIRRDFDGLMTAARIAFQRENWTQANTLADGALVLAPGNIGTLVFKSDVALKRGDQEGALAIVERLVADRPRSLAARLARIKVYLSVGMTDDAKPDVDSILAQRANLVIANYYRAIILAREGNMSGAWGIAHALPREFQQSDVEIAVNVADMAVGAGFLDSAATILSAAVFANPSLLEPRLELVDIRLRQKSPQYALNFLAVVEDSKDPRVSVLFARAYLMSKRSTEAQLYIARAIEQGGGEALAPLGKDVALASLRSWIAQHHDNLLARQQFALMLLRFHDLKGARTQYKQLVREHPDDALALNNLSWLVMNEAPARALDLAKRAVKLQPNSPDYWDTLGCMQLRQSDAKSALSSLRRAHQLRDSDPEITFHLATALDANGARADAKALLSTVASRDDFADRESAQRLLKIWR
jgi:predicted Zn-dependent protease